MTDAVDINQVARMTGGLQPTDDLLVSRGGSGPYRLPADTLLRQPGWSPVLALVSDGERRVHQVADWTGGSGTKPAAGSYIGVTGLVATAAEAVDVRGAQGAAGAAGPAGAAGAAGPAGATGAAGVNGWAPVLALVSDGERRVHQIADWTGGSGTKPAAGSYIGVTGLVATAAAAVDVRGAAGPTTDSAMVSALQTATTSNLDAIQGLVAGVSADAGNLLSKGADSKLRLLGSTIASWLAGLASNLGIGTASPLARFHVAAGNICVDNAYGFQGRLSSGALATLMRYKSDNKAYLGPNEEIVLDGSCSIAPPGELTLAAGFASSTGPTIRLKTGITINSNGLMAFDAISNTQVALKFRGNDGVTRSLIFNLT